MHTHTNNNKQPIHIHRHTQTNLCNWRDANCNFGDAATVFDFIIICFKEMQPQRCNYGEHMKHISCMMFAASVGEEGLFATEEMQPAISEMQPRFVISVLFVLKRCNHRDAIMVCFKEMQPKRCNRRDAATLFCKELRTIKHTKIQSSIRLGS